MPFQLYLFIFRKVSGAGVCISSVSVPDLCLSSTLPDELVCTKAEHYVLTQNQQPLSGLSLMSKSSSFQLLSENVRDYSNND